MRRSLRPQVDRLEGRALLAAASHPPHLVPPIHTQAHHTPATPSLATEISAKLQTDRASYKPGEPVTIALTVKNTSNHVVNFMYGPSLDGFSVTKKGAAVWTSNAGVEPDFIMLDPLQPGQSRTFRAVWNTPASLAPGTFQVHANFGVTAAPVKIRVT
jgi:hypothetical protein